MSLISRLFIVQSDQMIREGLRFGFEREGAQVDALGPEETFETRLAAGAPEVVIAGGADAEEGLSVLTRVRGALSDSRLRTPVIYLGNGVSRETALAEGADEVLEKPAYVRDVVTLATLLSHTEEREDELLTGELSNHLGVFYLVRAIAAAKKYAVLSVKRGLRQGELRFYAGEVTSANVGMLHGLAALHQLLLWTEGRFELRPEKVVRRQQIPFTREEFLVDAERFLGEVRAAAGSLSPSDVLELNPDADVTGLPQEVQQVLRLFEGSRTVADVVEDSPFRMFETLRVARRLEEHAFVRPVEDRRVRHRARAALAIEEWLVGGGDGGGRSEGDGAARRKRRASSIDWEAVLPARASLEAETLSPVVPSAAAAGEIVSSKASWPEGLDVGPSVQVDAPARERLEEVASGDQLKKMFATADQAEGDARRDGSPADEVDTQPVPKVSVEIREAAADSPEAATSADPPEVAVSPDSAEETPDAAEGTKEDIEGFESGWHRPQEVVREVAEPQVLAATASAARAAPDAANPSRAKPEGEDAAFSEDERAFFARGSELADVAPPPAESFEDLDEGYELPRTFWERFFRNPRGELKRARKPTSGGSRGRKK